MIPEQMALAIIDDEISDILYQNRKSDKELDLQTLKKLVINSTLTEEMLINLWSDRIKTWISEVKNEN